LFIMSDQKLGNDSSLVYNTFTKQFAVWQKSLGQKATKFTPSVNDLRTLLLSHVALEQPKGIARKEFVPNMAGSYLIVNNTTGEVSGTRPTTEGYEGTVAAPNFPLKVSSNSDNGSTYQINNWFKFGSTTIFDNLKIKFPLFYAAIKKAGLLNESLNTITFLSDNEVYTILAPTDAAMQKYPTAGLSKEALADFVRLHFIQGKLYFTDGNKPSGYVETMKLDKKSTDYTKFYTKIYLDLSPDNISVKAKDGSAFLSIPESEKSNILTGKDVTPKVSGSAPQPLFKSFFDNGVIHSIDNVLVESQLDTK
jgi:hypothetical protein